MRCKLLLVLHKFVTTNFKYVIIFTFISIVNVYYREASPQAMPSYISNSLENTQLALGMIQIYKL